jgi:DNA primase
MGGGIPQDLLERIRERTDIVALIGEYVQLKRRGRNYVGLCPFHEERAPSFTVSPEKQMFYCFGCQAGGSAFNFVMLKEDLPFAGAVRFLARRAGITLPEDDTPEARRRESERAALLRAMELAARYFCARLGDAAGEKARRYLESRGLDEATIAAFRLGYAPPVWRGLSDALAGRGIAAEVLERCGLAARSTAGEGLYDRFRDRLMFPITDRRGRVIAFGGRALDEGAGPKYLNSPETPLFAKRRALYGFDRARDVMARQGEAVVVEGYLDLIACHRAGVSWAVASLGTALSQEQAMELSRLARQVVIAYDADSAGSAATLRGLEILQRLGARLRVAELEPGEDPDSLLRKQGAAALKATLEAALPLYEYRLRRAVEGLDTGSVEGRVVAVRRIVPVLAGVEDAVECAEYLTVAARRIGVDVDALRAEVARHARGATARGAAGHRSGAGWHNRRDYEAIMPADAARGAAGAAAAAAAGRAPGATAGSASQAAERQLLALLVQDPARALALGGSVSAEDFTDPVHRAVAGALFAAVAEAAAGREPAAAAAVASGVTVGGAVAGDEAAARLAARLAVEEVPATGARGLLDLARVLREEPSRQRVVELRRRIAELDGRGEPVPPELLAELHELLRATKTAPRAG